MRLHSKWTKALSFEELYSLLSALCKVERFNYYIPPALSEIKPTQASAGSTGSTVVTIYGSGFSALDDAQCRIQLHCDGRSFEISGPAVQAEEEFIAGTGDIIRNPLPYVTCALPRAPCAGKGVLSYAANGQDFVHHVGDCPSQPEHDGCFFQILSPPGGAKLPLPPGGASSSSPNGGSSSPSVPGREGVSALGVVGVALGVLAWVGAGALVTKGAERRRLVRQWNGSATPYSVAEAYVIWLFSASSALTGVDHE